MYVLPSTSVSRAPFAERMNSGSPPTAVKARTGLSTPPGRIFWARVNSFEDAVERSMVVVYRSRRAASRAK
jgi:hypothetical protein